MRRDVADALAAYAFGAVWGNEARTIRSALRADPRLRRTADGYRDTASRLLARFEPVEPDASVWDRIESATAGGESAPLAPRSHRGRVGPMLFAAAVAAAFLLGVAMATVVERATAPNDMAAVAAVLAADPSSATLGLADPGTGERVATLVVGTDGTAVVSGERLPSLDAGHTYQLWAIVDGEVVSVGLLGQNPTAAAVRLDVDPTVLAVTVERAGGVVASDQQPVAVWSGEA
jgi:anti-sigma-K factor RskA